MLKTFKVIITGQVQGVGFRPFVYVLAKRHGLTGTVSNNEEGVIIYLTGPEADIRSLITSLIKNPPEVSRINSCHSKEIEFQPFDSFKIIQSQKGSKLNLQLTPDFAICIDCAKEITDTDNRRYYYPFTTCVNCGPRWAITNTFPFERDHTSIVEFKMCPDCEDEYTNPEDRRFHSQTNSCSKCGINLHLANKEGEILNNSNTEFFEQIAQLLKDGNIIAIKNTSGYLLCCDATNKEVVRKLRARKKRPTKPFAILYPTIDMLQQQLSLTKHHLKSLASTERPIVIIPKSDYNGNLAVDELAPGLNQLGIMMPYTGILELLAKSITMPIVATSGNLHGSPIISNNEESFQLLSSVADYFVNHNLSITNPQDDSVVKFSARYGQEILFRRSRGYAPNFFGKEHSTSRNIMAMGGHLKSTIGFLPNDYMYVSQYLGNLDHFDVYNRFTKTAQSFIEIFEQKPDTILIDSHPAYNSTQHGIELGKKLKAEVVKIQHHKAHFASVLGEHELFDSDEPILGVIWDGTGFGDDHQIWGGEFFTYQSKQMERASHFEYFDWLAGDKMAKEPRLSFFSLADKSMEQELAKKFNDRELAIYRSLIKKNELKTSSVGRLFDAVASLLNICDQNSYEGEAAILLENSIGDYDLEKCTAYATLTERGKLPTQLLFLNLYSHLKNGVDRETIVTNFLYTLASLVFQVANNQKVRAIGFSGGVFQNTVLVDMLIEMAKNDFILYFNRNLSPNDENISFGQINHYLYCKDN